MRLINLSGKRLRLICLSWRYGCFLGALAATSVVFAAGAPVNTAGFETFTLGALDPITTPGTLQLGQQGWVGLDQNGGTSNVTNAVIQSAVVQSGTKALKVDRAAGVDNRWTVLFGNSPNPAVLALTLPQNRIVLPTHRFMLVDWDMNVTGTGAENGAVGPFFGVESFGTKAADQGLVGALGSLGVDATTAEVIYQAGGTGFFENTGAEVSFNEWNHFGMVIDFTLQKYAVYLNGTLLKTTALVDSVLYGGLDRFTDADISAMRIFDDALSTNLPGTAYLDNFRVLDGVPGDFDFDGDVDPQDLTLWRAAFNTTAVGDADGDSDSDGNDFLIWQQNSGTDVTPAVAATNAAPEPSAAALMTLAALAISGVRRRGLLPHSI